MYLIKAANVKTNKYKTISMKIQKYTLLGTECTFPWGTRAQN